MDGILDSMWKGIDLVTDEFYVLLDNRWTPAGRPRGISKDETSILVDGEEVQIVFRRSKWQIKDEWLYEAVD